MSIRAVLEGRDFRRYLLSWLCANLAAEMLAVAVGWEIYAQTHRALDLGWIGLVQFVPALALSLPAGALADHTDRARIVAACELALAAAALALVGLATAGVTSVVPIYAVLLVVGVARTIEAPAAQALVPSLVAPAEVATAVSWSSTAWQVSTIAGPALGGALYVLGARAVYATCAASCALAALLASTIRATPNDDAGGDMPSWARVREGLRFVRAQPVILQAISLDLFAVLLGGATALLPIIASDVLGAGPSGLGLLRAAPAVGATAMAVVLAHRPIERRAGATLLGGVAVFGAATIVFGLSHNLALSCAALALAGAADMISVVVRGTVVQLRTPPAMRGRVSAVGMLFVSGSADLGQLESGAAAALLGAVPAVVLGGVGTLLVVAGYAIACPALRDVDRLDETAA